MRRFVLARALQVSALAFIGFGMCGCIDLVEWFVETIVGVDLSGPDGESYCEYQEYLGNPLSQHCADELAGTSSLKAAVVRRPKAKEFTFYAGPDVARPNYKRTRVPVELAPPFRVEMTVGLCDPSFAPDSTARFGGAVAENGGVGRWALLCRNSGGLDVSATFGGKATKSFPGALRVDLAFDHDGTQIVGYARDPETSATWTEVDRVVLGTNTGAFFSDLVALDFQPGAMSTVYALKFITNAATESGAGGPQAQAAVQIAGASAPLLAAQDALTGLGADAAQAAADLDAAKAAVDQAVTNLDPLKSTKTKKTPEQKAIGAAVKRLKAVSKKLAAYAKTLRKSGLKTAKSTRKQIAAAVKDLVRAFDGAVPASVRAAIGSRKLSDYVAK